MRTPRTVSALGLLLLLAPALSAAGPLDAISHRDKLYDIAVRGDEVFVVGYPGLLLHSPDRGVSWEQLEAGTHDALFAVDFSAGGQGVIVGRSGLVLTSADGGRSWQRRRPDIAEHLFDVELTDSGQAWAVGHFGTIVHSPDAGASWTRQEYQAAFPEGTPPEERGVVSTAEAENQGAAAEARLNAVGFADDQHGWIAGEFGMVLHTEDGGATWKRQPSASGKLLFSLHVFDREHVMVAGSEGTLMETRDGGRSWRAIPTGLHQHLLDLWPQGEDLFLVGREGIVLVRRGAAAELDQLPAGIYTWLEAVRFFDAETGLAAGGRGYLLRTTDGGASWRRLSGR